VRRASGDVRRIEPEYEMPLTIRSATVADVPLILDLIRGLAEYERLPHEVVATEALLRETLFGPAPGAEVLLAELDGESAGFALFFHNFSTFLGRRGLYLEDLFVRPAARGRGIGKALMRHLARTAIDRGCGRFVWQVLDWNAPSLAFYESLGANVVREWLTCRLEGPALAALATAGPADATT
jgi:GNAT superfamily N-acetyltransferase